MSKTIFALAGAAVVAVSTPASAVPVDLELLFMNDVSGSITAGDFAFQKAGYAAAFRDADLIDQIQNGAIGKIAVSVAFFAGSVAQTVPWTIIEDVASGEAFAQIIEAATRPSVGFNDNTSVSLTTSLGFFDGNGIEGTRSVIDIVTEGAQDVSGCSESNPVCLPLQDARDNALASGIDQINALLLDDRDFFGNDPEDQIDAVSYAETNMIGGDGAFAAFEEDFTGFAPAIRAKIEREVVPPDDMAPIPLPAPALMLGAALLGLGAVRRKRS